MFDLSRYEELMLRHRHNDGSWAELEATAAANHDAAAHDPERAWDDEPDLRLHEPVARRSR